MKKNYGCHHCKKDCRGNFYNLSMGAFLVEEKEDSSVSPPAGYKVEPWLTIHTHPADPETGKHREDPNMWGKVDLFKAQQWNYTDQAESNFCSKDCIVEWVKAKLKKVPEINI